ncbi:MAG: hypothetical protein ACQEQ8_01405 [Pseudomonadota bacterium]
MFKQKIWPIAIGLIGLVTLSSATYADDKVVYNQQFSVDASTELNIDNGVGEVEFIRGDSNQLLVELTIKASEEGFFFGGGDINQVKLEDQWRGQQLTLSIEPDEDVQANWRITLPQVAAVNVDMGVGEIHGELVTTDTELDLGVGEIDLTFYGEDIASITADVGIGDSSISGFSGGRVEKTTAVVSSESNASGNGRHRISADVGVGDVSITVKGLK